MTEARPVSGGESLASVGRSALILTGAALVVQIVGFARQLFLAAEVGLTSGLDALFIGLAVPMAFTGVLESGVRPAILPAYSEAKDERGRASARRLVGTVLVWMAIAGLGISCLQWLLADSIVAVTGPGLAAEGTADAAARYLRMLAPMAFIGAVTAVYLALCQVESMFPAIAVAILVGPVIAFTMMVFYWDSLGLDGLVMGTLIGAVVGLVILMLTTIARRVAPIPRLRPSEPGVSGIVRHATPLTLSAAILQINEAVSRAIASLLLVGGVSALRLGESLVRLPFSAVRPAYGTAIYPALVRASRNADTTHLASTTVRILRYGLVLFVPLASLTIAVAPAATAIVYGRGSFTEDDVVTTTAVVAVSAPLIVTWTVTPTIVSALNARRKGRTLLAGGMVNVVANVVLSVGLGLLLGVVGVALAMTIASAVVVSFLGWRLTRSEPGFSMREVWSTLIRAGLASLPGAVLVGIPIWLLQPDGPLVYRVSILCLAGVVGLVSYYVMARRLGLAEVSSIVMFALETLRRLWMRLRPGM